MVSGLGRSLHASSNTPGIDARGAGGVSPLHAACARGQAVAAEMLLAAGADVCAVDGSGFTPLHRAAHHGRVDIARMLLQAEVRLAVAAVPQHRGALAAAAAADRGVDVSLRMKGGLTALHCACLGGSNAQPGDVGEGPSAHLDSQGAAQCVDLLIEYGANKEALDLWQCTPLLRGSLGGPSAVPAALRLLARGADVDARDSWSCSALHRACESGNVELVRALLLAGASAAVKSCSGRNPGQAFLDDATKEQRDAVRVALVEHAHRSGAWAVQPPKTPVITGGGLLFTRTSADGYPAEEDAAARLSAAPLAAVVIAQHSRPLSAHSSFAELVPAFARAADAPAPAAPSAHSRPGNDRSAPAAAATNTAAPQPPPPQPTSAPVALGGSDLRRTASVPWRSSRQRAAEAADG
ncbi:ankyrin repeat-containing domain protein [Tribonema minus]|uniref:Ankyrin repeat-containing domain protein n=1 Tax=Tribonema minus TaxID=303371 RepID=A0A835ZE33_9STRA|nr:ankyrin repeat-containing domain protein [Tribonema minus]